MIRNCVKKRMADKKGFTLIELIVVIAILIVLMAMMVPMLSKYIENAKYATKKANAREVYSAAAAWVANEMANNRKLEKEEIGPDQLKDYFNNSANSSATYKATIDTATGKVTSATYDDVTYPDTN